MQLLSARPRSARPGPCAASARRLCTKAAQDAIDDAKALTGNGVEYTDRARVAAGRLLHSHDAVAARGADGRHCHGRGRQQYKSRSGARGGGSGGPTRCKNIPMAMSCYDDVVLGAAGPGARARGRRRRAAVPVGQEAGLSGRLAARGDAELARGGACCSSRPTRCPTRRAASRRGPARRRGAVADLRRFNRATRTRGHHSAIGRRRSTTRRRTNAEVEARCLTLFGRLVEQARRSRRGRGTCLTPLAEAGADDEEIDSERFCGAPRVLSRVARDR